MKKVVKVLGFACCFCVAACTSKNTQDTVDEVLATDDSVETTIDTVAQEDSTKMVVEKVATSSEWIEQGSLLGEFSVSPTKKVNFSKGNLQYRASDKTWRFARNQYDYIGKKNVNIANAYSGWIDLFGWGTSGFNGHMPSKAIVKLSEYTIGENDIAQTNYDWGVYNAISNGGNKPGVWRTLTKEEWIYLFEQREKADSLFGGAAVNGRLGFIFLPDDWKCPDSLKFVPNLSQGCTRDGLFYHNSKGDNFVQNIYTLAQWKALEKAGAVFLPAAGSRYEREVSVDEGTYWLATHRTENSSYMIVFGADEIGTESYFAIFFGRSVRLVQDARKH